MIDEATNKEERQAQRKMERKMDRGEQMLAGKAALVVGNDRVFLQNLVVQLAKKGADITLLCWEIPLEVARKMNDQVQSFGQQLILIEQAENQRFSVEQLIRNVVSKWGRFDIFINISARDETAVSNEVTESDRQTAWLLPKWRLTQMVLKGMGRA